MHANVHIHCHGTSAGQAILQAAGTPFHSVPCTGVPPGLTARNIATPLKADAWDKALAGHPNSSTLNRHAARVPHWHPGGPSVQGQFEQHPLGTRAKGGCRQVYANPAGKGIYGRAVPPQ